jgi:hypothetical protein
MSIKSHAHIPPMFLLKNILKKCNHNVRNDLWLNVVHDIKKIIGIVDMVI